VSVSRDAMIEELKRTVVPVLRDLGFRGSFPHFRRSGDKQIDLLTFQFASGGGRFVVEVGKFPADGYELAGAHLSPEKVKMRHLLRRLRLGAKGVNDDHWFDFEDGDYARAAEAVVPYVRGQAARWWSRA
jgi:hypothetical protein